MKDRIWLIAGILLLAAALSLSQASADSVSGSAGPQLRYYIDSGNVLHITGTGAMNEGYEDPRMEASWDFGGNSQNTDPWIDWGWRRNIRGAILEEGVTSISSRAFAECSQMEFITLPSTLTSIGLEVFDGCDKLREIDLPENVKQLSGRTFTGSGLSAINVSPDNPSFASENGVLYTKDRTRLIRFPPRKAGRFTLPDRVITVGNEAFAGSVLNELTLHEGITNIGKYTFLGARIARVVFLAESLSFDDFAIERANIGELDMTNVRQLSYKDEGGLGSTFTLNVRSLSILLNAQASIGYIEDCLNYDTSYVWGPSYTLKVAGEEITDLVIPEGITSIRPGAFAGCSSIRTVRYPASLNEIGSNAFYKCVNLIPTAPPAGVTMGKGVFYGCKTQSEAEIYASQMSRTEVEGGVRITYSGALLPGGLVPADTVEAVLLDPYVKTIADNAFINCTKLKDVVFPESLTAIGKGAFRNCRSLAQIAWPDQIAEIGDDMFNGCVSLSSVTIPDGVTAIGANAFKGCDQLTSVTVPDSVSVIADGAFDPGVTIVCSRYSPAHSYAVEKGLKYSLNGSMASIYWTKNGTDLKVSGGGDVPALNAAGRPAWGADITQALIQEGVAGIGAYAFNGCSRLNYIFIPDSVTQIADNAFTGCEDLTVRSSAEAYAHTWALQHGFAWEKRAGTCGDQVHWLLDNDRVLHLSGSGRMSDYTSVSETPWGGLITGLHMTGGITYIGAHAFDGCVRLTGITLNVALEEIGDSAFRECLGLAALTLPDSLTRIGQDAFTGCTALKTLTVGSGLTDIGDRAFSGCAGLKSVTLPAGLLSIGAKAFAGAAITEVTIPDSVSYIGDLAFDSGVTVACSPDGYAHGWAVAAGLSWTARYSGATAGGLTWTLDASSGALVIGGSGTIPAYAPGAAPWGDAFTGLTVAEGVTGIAANAFKGCGNIQTVDLPNSLLTIGESAFEDCTGLKSLQLSPYKQGVPSLKAIGPRAFKNCTALNTYTLVIPTNVETLGDECFYGDRALQGVTLSGAITRVGSYCFAGCTSMTGIGSSSYINGVYAPERLPVAVIGDHAFMNCSSLKTAGLPRRTRTVGASAFEGCKALATVSLPAEITTVGANAYKNCTALESITLPDGLTSLGNACFIYCKNLRSITIPDSLTKIGRYTFGNCEKLYLVDLGSAVRSIDEYAFKNCGLLSAFNLPADSALTAIGEEAFLDCAALAEIALPAGLTQIGARAFAGTALSRTELTANVTAIGDGAFEPVVTIVCPMGTYAYSWAADHGLPWEGPLSGVCGDGLTWIYQEGLRTLSISGTGPMYDYAQDAPAPWGTVAQKLVIGEGVTSVGKWAFVNCAALEDVTLPITLTAIGQSAFEGCVKLAAIELPEGFRTIGANAFKNCERLAALRLPESLTVLGNSSLNGCRSLNELVIPDKVTKVGRFALANCTALHTVTVGASAASVDAYAFYNCPELNTVTLPQSVLSIDDTAFEGCRDFTVRSAITAYAMSWAYERGVAWENTGETVLSILALPDSLTAVESAAFSGLPDTLGVIMGSRVTAIADDAFQGTNFAIIAPADSYAATWAKDHGVRLIPKDLWESHR